MRRFLWILPSAWLATFLFAAAWVEAHPHGAEPIIIGIAPQQEPAKVYAMWQPFLRYLEREVGHAFAFETAPSIEEFQKRVLEGRFEDRKSTRLNSSHGYISYAVFCLKK